MLTQKRVHERSQHHYSQQPNTGNNTVENTVSISGKMHKQDVVSQYDHILLTMKKNEVAIHATAWVDLKKMTVSEQTRQKRLHVM